MSDSDEFLYFLEKVGSSLLNGGLLHQSLVRVLGIENYELPYQRVKTTPFIRSRGSLLGFLQLKSSNNERAGACVVKVYRAFLLNSLVLLLRQLTFDFCKRDLYINN